MQGRSKPSLDDGKPQAARDQAQATPRRERQQETHAVSKPRSGILRELDEEQRHIE